MHHGKSHHWHGDHRHAEHRDRERFARGGHHGERGHERHGRGGRRSGRVFDHGELRLVVMALIAERPRHGYELIREIEDRLAGTYSPSPGVIYPTLTMLEEIGHATVAEADGKKLYAITPEGTAWMAANAAAVATVMSRMEEVFASHGGGPAPSLTRAMGNLKLALSLRQGRGPLTEEQLERIAAAIDTAALAIERA